MGQTVLALALDLQRRSIQNVLDKKKLKKLFMGGEIGFNRLKFPNPRILRFEIAKFFKMHQVAFWGLC